MKIFHIWYDNEETGSLTDRLYTGREYDRETGLYYLRARYYDSELGRFLERDPLGMVDSTNLYAYVANNPLKWTDRSGMSLMGDVSTFLAENPRIDGVVKVGLGVGQSIAGGAMAIAGGEACLYSGGAACGIGAAGIAYGTDQAVEGVGVMGDGFSQIWNGTTTSVGADTTSQYNPISIALNATPLSCGEKTVVKTVVDVVITHKLSSISSKGKILGGAYKDVRSANRGGQVHHIPAQSASPLPKNIGPSIWMSKVDHLETASHGVWGKSASEYRLAQKELIEQGNMKGAIDMDIQDIRSKFGDKYDSGIRQALDYFNSLK